MSNLCTSCGEPLQTLASLASDAHDPPAFYCPCWPTDWPVVLMQVTIVVLLIVTFFVLSRIL